MVVAVKDYTDDSISPILRGSDKDCTRIGGSSDSQTGGYASDHSSRSPLSSLHSSPAGSPFGSSTALPGSNQNHSQGKLNSAHFSPFFKKNIYLTENLIISLIVEPRLGYRPNGMLQRKGTYGLMPPPKTKVR